MVRPGKRTDSDWWIAISLFRGLNVGIAWRLWHCRCWALWSCAARVHCGTVGVGTRFKVVGRQVRGASFCRWARFMACSCFVTLRAALAGGALYAPPACQSATTPLLESPGLEVAGQLVLRVLRIRRFVSDLLTTCDSTVTGLSWGVCAVSDTNDHCFNCRSPGSHLASDAYMPIEVDLNRRVISWEHSRPLLRRLAPRMLR
jgi:hypothetical protein